MKKFLALFLVSFIITTPLFPNEKVSLQLKWLHQFQFAGYYAAKEKGFYDEVGLDVEIKERIISKNNIEQVINNESEYGIADSILTLYKAKNEPVVIVAPIFQNSPSILMTLKEGGLDSPSKLDKKRLLFYKNDNDSFSILAMLRNANAHPVITRERGKEDYKKLINKETDVIPGYLTNEPFYFQKEGVEINILNPTNYGFPMYGDMIFTNKEEATKHPQRVINFKKASIKGWEYALNNKEEIADLIINKYNSTKSKEHLLYEANAIEEMIQKNSFPIGTLDKGRIEYIINLYKQEGILEEDIQLDSFIFQDFASNINLTPEEIAFKSMNTKVKYCINPNWLPYEKIENGKHIGITADLLQEFKRLINIDVEIVSTKSWADSLEAIRDGKCDLLTLAARTPSREEFLNFTKPYKDLLLVLATKIQEPFISNLRDLKGVKVGVLNGAATRPLLASTYKDLNFVDVKSIKDGLEKVRNGELFGYISTVETIVYSIQQNFQGQLKISGQFDKDIPVSIATTKDKPLLNSIFNKAIDNIDVNKEQEITNKWISVRYEKGTNYIEIFKYVGVVVFVFAVIIFIFVRANSKLNKEVKKRKKTEERLQNYIDIVDENVIISTTDLNGTIISASTNFTRISQYSKKELIGKNHNIVRHSEMSREFFGKLWKTISSGKVWQGEIKNRAKDGSTYWVHTTISPVYEDGLKVGYTAVRQDITDKKLIEEISITDGLTNIFNRRKFNELFSEVFLHSKESNEPLSFVMLDIDFFKQYNDTYGHQMGDDVLINVADAIKKTLKERGYFFRLGGEEFGVLLQSYTKEDAFEVTQELCKSIEDIQIPHKHNKASKFITASFGLYHGSCKDVDSEDTVYKTADEMLYQAKQSGRNRVVSN